MPIPAARLQPGETVDGFAVTSVTPLEDLRALAYQFEHVQSGARVLHVHADDAENLFSVTFPTLPRDDSGAPHILEHSVLGGSRKYPVRQPFFEMIKMSMGTYINAFTATDYTSYPVASPVKQDLFHLADVYFDAVFHPLLTRETFEREGHRLAPADPRDPTGPLKETGIVFNEMKGYYSRPDTRLWLDSEAALLPDTVYARSSGGRPDAIPDLTYEGLRQFYDTFYHPSNAYFFLYGDIPPAEYLAFLGPRLQGFAPRPTDARIARQARWQAPRRQESGYQLGQGESPREKTYILVQWLAGTTTDPREHVAFEVLERILLGHEAAPLRKALVDSRLGQDLTHAGYGSSGAEAVFQVGLKGSEPDRAERFEQLVLDTLRGFAEAEAPRAQIEAAFHQAAYHHLEILPLFPLHLRARVVEAWRLGADPFTFVRMRTHLADCRARFEADPLLFRRIVRERLVDNPHRLLTVLAPSTEYQARQDAAFAERMRGVRAGLSDEQARQVAERSAEVERQAGTPNPPENVALLPQLRIGDVPRRPRHIPTAVEHLDGGVQLLRNDLFTNGVNYLALHLDLADLAPARWRSVPRYLEAVDKMGAAGLTYEQMAHRIAASCGGIDCQPILSGSARPGAEVRALRFGTKALDDQMEDALAVLTDLLFAVDPTDRDRLHVVLDQSLAGLRTGLVNGGAGTAVQHAGRRLHLRGQIEEQMGGVSQLHLLERLHAGGADAEVVRDIEGLRDLLLTPGRLTLSFTGSDAAYDAVRRAVAGWVRRMTAPAPAAPAGGAVSALAREGLAAPVDVAYCAQVMAAPRYDHPDSAALAVGAHLLTSEYILPEIRFKGTAYGGTCSYDALGGQISLLSWQDPHVARTLGVFAGARDHAAAADWSQIDVDRAIIGTLKEAERPARPGPATQVALSRHVLGVTAELRDARHQATLAVTVASMKNALLAALDAGLPHSGVCVVASRRMLEDANGELGADALAMSDLLGAERAAEDGAGAPA